MYCKKSIVYAIALVLFSVGCIQYSTNFDLQKNEYNKNVDKTYNETPLLITDFINSANYKIIPRIFEYENIKITYPQIIMANEEKQNIINMIIWKEMNNMLLYFPERDELTLEITYEIKVMSDRLLSIIYTGVGFVQGAAGPLIIFFTTNINIITGERIVLSDVLNINDEFIELLKSDYILYSILNLDLRKFIKEIISRENFSIRLKNADNSKYIGTIYKSEIFTYFTNNGLGISIGGLGRGAGSHVELEIG
ncbi:MAG: hypothetical protein FWE02_03965 [Defluviitaleaceae bacterium]|nr:hypothetical protein [Defluviitaleaceae bacterium]